MMQLNRDKKGAGKTVRVAYDGFRLFPTGEKGKLTAAYSKNCSCADGVLQGGIGYVPYFDRDGAAVKTPQFNDKRGFYILECWSDGEGTGLTPYYFLHTDDGKIWKYSNVQGGYIEMGNVGVNANMVSASAPNGQTRIILCGEEGAYCIDGDSWTKIDGVATGKGTAAAVFSKHRAFIAEKPCKLLYSNPELPWDFTSSYDDGGYVYLPLNKGDIVDMLEYGDSVYVFFQRGIVRVKPDGLARNFQVHEVPYSGGEIFARSVGICENWIFFLSENGICRFDGNNVERVGRGLEVVPSKQNQRCAHATVGEYFILQYYDDERWTMQTIALRADDKDKYFLSYYEGLNESNRMPICLIGNRVATLKHGGDLPMGERFEFATGYVGLEGAGRKYLKSVTLYGEGRLDFFVRAGEEEKEFNVEDLPQRQKIAVNMRAEDFAFAFILDKGAKVRRMEIEYECID